MKILKEVPMKKLFFGEKVPWWKRCGKEFMHGGCEGGDLQFRRGKSVGCTLSLRSVNVQCERRTQDVLRLLSLYLWLRGDLSA